MVLDRFVIKPRGSALVIVDIQDKLVAAVEEADRVVANALHLIELSRLYDIPVLITQQYPRGLGQTVPALRDALPGVEYIDKMTFSCCKDVGFTGALKAVDRKAVILCGIETHICVLQTCVELLAMGYFVHVVRDCVASRSKDNKDTAIEYMRDAGAVITTTETVLFQVLREAGTDNFKTIAKRIV
ncbi:MAG: hydrolase [Magnetococcales bacterium]|uniref:Hydrolase n=1 Tax=Candidatus Magnetobacterium casense TaxID=1455061 RepID=A0ABS6RUS3_9BACT|nr:hydrolase [Nitrospirota bacterium]MBV6340380.1 hydrolase [Candidatus Magnetobacterium casensis]